MTDGISPSASNDASMERSITPSLTIQAGVLLNIPISKLARVPDYNARLSGNQLAHVRRLLESDPDYWPPIIVTPWDDDAYLVLDGNHRWEAAKELDLDSLQCHVIEGGGYREAFEANRCHGLPLALEDRKAYATWLHDDAPNLSYREIGRRCGLHHATVKAALEGTHADASAPAVAPAKPKPPAVNKLVSLVLRATDNNEGIGLFNRDKRTELLKSQIEEYDNVCQTDVAHALDVWGRAMQSAAARYLKMDLNR